MPLLFDFSFFFLSQKPLNTLVFPERLKYGQEDFNIGLFLELPKISFRISQVCVSAQSHWNGLVTKGRRVLIVIQCNLYKLGVWGITRVSDLGWEFPSVRYLKELKWRNSGLELWKTWSRVQDRKGVQMSKPDRICVQRRNSSAPPHAFEGQVKTWFCYSEKENSHSTGLGFHPRLPHYSKTLM